MEAENHSNCDIAAAAAVKGFIQTNGFEWAAFVGWTRRVKFCICSDISTSGSDNEQLRICVLACQSSFLHGQNVMH